jgi:hypothetical protein
MGSQAKAPAPLNRKSLCVNVGQTLSSANSVLMPIFFTASERPVLLIFHHARCFASRLAVNPAPKAKRTSGPNVFADGFPTKYIPDTEHSKFDDNTGVFCAERMSRRTPDSRKLKRRRSAV